MTEFKDKKGNVLEAGDYVCSEEDPRTTREVMEIMPETYIVIKDLNGLIYKFKQAEFLNTAWIKE